ncbi:2-aminoethanethiol dioxygenase [Elysia marginata]|uniref:2-aminoethanethiol dioxygenase n=1 Tax=Elysia marginata TaxID=1093978 RepID=A0AAV4J1L0_9GAST|nr:2-aminoethanethiol dioxygenase [Elysia marginata]
MPKMATPIQRLAHLSYKIFGSQSNDIVTKDKLYPLIQSMNEIKAGDLNFDPNEVVTRDEALKMRGDMAPVTVMNVHQNRHFTMAVFIVKTGGSLPLHDHPNMFGLLKVISGSVKITSYTKVDPQPLPKDVQFPGAHSPYILTVKRNQDVILADSDHCCFLSPSEGNFHEIKPLTDVAAFLDILAPPYNSMDRECSYYKELPLHSPDHEDICWLTEISHPRSYWCDVLNYKGPLLNPIDYSSEDSS